MLSKKMTFSLMSLITLLAFAFVAPVATAGVLGEKFATTITLEGDSAGDNVIESGDTAVSIKVVFAKAVGTHTGDQYLLPQLLLMMLSEGYVCEVSG